MNLGSDGITGSGGANVNQIAGPVEYGFSTFASAGEQNAINACVQSSGVATGACADISLSGVSCSLAESVIAGYRRAPGMRAAHGIVVRRFAVHGQRTLCKTLAGVAACEIGHGSLAFSSKRNASDRS